VQYQKSYSSKIIIAISREKWVYNELKKVAVKIQCEPYIKITGSLHKFFLGHNLFGGSDNIKYQVEYLLRSIEVDLELTEQLPNYSDWYINRIDYARIYNLGSQKNVMQYFSSMQNVKYPRSKVIYYEGESLYKGGRSTSVKIYNKLQEFKQHDMKKWKKYNPQKCTELLVNADGLVRCEIEVKKPKMQYDLQKSEIKLNEITIDYLKNIFKTEIERLLNEGEEMEKVKNNAQVRMILQNKLSPELFRLVYGFYNDMCLNGYKSVKSTMAKATYYRYKKILKELGINYVNHNITNENAVYFNPLIDKSLDTDLIAM
jgi:II/X family phage/plasmid replication protein